MKQLFRKKDIIMSPVVEGNREIFEVSTFYNNINNAIANQGFLNVCPIDHEDLSIKRANLAGMFKNRAKFLFGNSISLAAGTLKNLENLILDKNESIKKYDINISLDYSESINTIYKQIPYITDLIFYFNINIMDYSSLLIIAMNMSTIVYNELYMSSYINLGKSEIEQIHNNINNIFKALTESFLSDLTTLTQEAKIYYEAGNYEYNESTDNFKRGISLEQEFNENQYTLQTNNAPVIGAATEDQIVEHFRRFLKEEVYGI